MASGKVFTEIPISANGDHQKPKATEFTHGETVIDMKVNGNNV